MPNSTDQNTKDQESQRQARYAQCFAEAARDLKDCRFCMYYSFDRDIEIEFFDCDKGHFHFVNHGAFGKNEGEMRWFGCDGKDFSFNPNSRWLNGWKSDLEKETIIRMHFPDYFNYDCNKILRTAFEDIVTWRITPSGYTGTEAIAAFSFGFGPEKKEGGGKQYDPRYFHPGKSNEVIADLIYELKEQNPKINPGNIFAQWEIAESLAQNYDIKIPEEHIAKPGENYLGTRGVADKFFDSGLGEFRSVSIFAHPMHIYRCKKTLIKSSKDRGLEEHARCIYIPNTDSVPFDENSVQPWTRNLEAWILHELNSRAYARSKGDM